MYSCYEIKFDLIWFGRFPYRGEDVIVGAVDIAAMKDVDVVVLWQLDTRWL